MPLTVRSLIDPRAARACVFDFFIVVVLTLICPRKCRRLLASSEEVFGEPYDAPWPNSVAFTNAAMLP